MQRALALILLLLAADRQWQSGTWGSPSNERTYVISSAKARLELEDPVPGEKRALEVSSGTSVKFAVEKEDVFVLDRAGAEHRLHLLRQVSLVYNAVGGGHYIKTVGPEGRFVTLEDDSIWEIEARSLYITQHWQPFDGISVRTTPPENGFNYEVDNSDQDNGALARFSPP